MDILFHMVNVMAAHDLATKRAWASHYNDAIMGAIASLITSLTIVYSTVYSGSDQRIHQSSALLAFVRGIHRDAENVSIWWRHHDQAWSGPSFRGISRAPAEWRILLIYAIIGSDNGLSPDRRQTICPLVIRVFYWYHCYIKFNKIDGITPQNNTSFVCIFSSSGTMRFTILQWSIHHTPALTQLHFLKNIHNRHWVYLVI